MHRARRIHHGRELHLAEQSGSALRHRFGLGANPPALFNNLLNLDDHMRVAPGLAERLEPADYQTYLHRTLRRGVGSTTATS